MLPSTVAIAVILGYVCEQHKRFTPVLTPGDRISLRKAMTKWNLLLITGYLVSSRQDGDGLLL